MERKKIINLLNISSNRESNVARKKWYVIDSQTAKDKNNQYNSNKFETKSIKSSLFNYSNPFLLVTWDITVTANNTDDASEINEFNDEANNIYIALPMYNSIEYSVNYSDTLGSL